MFPLCLHIIKDRVQHTRLYASLREKENANTPISRDNTIGLRILVALIFNL
jgi:hypothetical protein